RSAAALGGVRLASLLLDDERVVVVRPVQLARDGPAVDEERRRRVDAGAVADVHVLADARPGGGIVETSAKRREVEAEVPRVAEQALALEVLVILEQHVVVLPEPPLVARALRRDRRETGVRVQWNGQARVAARVERIVPEHEADVGARAEELAELRKRLGAVRALEVGELDDGDGRILGPLHVLLAGGELAER